jgi:XTP/dITP diphosphohydrolase
VYSARYGFDESLDDWGRMLLLLKNTEHVPDGQRQAKFVCVISFVTPEGKIIQARGEIHGELTRQPRGENGFGYDPIFYYPPFGQTTAEIPSELKNQVSHRGNALRIFYEKLKEEGYADK